MAFTICFTLTAQDFETESYEVEAYEDDVSFYEYPQSNFTATLGYENEGPVLGLSYDIFDVGPALVSGGIVLSDENYVSYNVGYPLTSWLETSFSGRTSFQDNGTQWQASFSVPLSLGDNEVSIRATYNISEEYFGGYLSFRL